MKTTIVKRCRYIRFESIDTLPGVIAVRSNSSNGVLGRVQWYPAWHQCVFAPEAETVYSQDCLMDIAAFCEEQAVRAADPKAEKQG